LRKRTKTSEIATLPTAIDYKQARELDQKAAHAGNTDAKTHFTQLDILVERLGEYKKDLHDGSEWPIETQRLFVPEISAGAQGKERKAPPISLCPKPKGRIRLLFPRL
jgi:hypothetical protein